MKLYLAPLEGITGTELGVIAAVDHHDIVGIIDLFRHAAVERSIDR